MSAVRNLNGTDVGGRPLRIDLADSDPFLEGKTTVRGELVDSGPESRWREREKDFEDRRNLPRNQDPSVFLSSLGPGVQVPPGSTALDTISQNLATMNPSQLMEVLAQMKVC
jgi:cleavage stimulation factor subunit 2